VQGMPAAGAMAAFSTLGKGSFSHDDKYFYLESISLGPIADRIGFLSTARRLVVSSCEGGGETTIFLLAGAVAAVASLSDKALRAAWTDGPRRREGLEAFPEFIALLRDEEGRLIIPQSRVTALGIFRREVRWHLNPPLEFCPPARPGGVVGAPPAGHSRILSLGDPLP
jgi:hypothetical protein